MALRSRGGSHYHECTVCHERVDEGEHIEEIIPAVEATCTAKGKTAGKKCSVCDAILEEQTETDMIAHTPDGVYVPTETGHYQKCSVCETALQEEEHTAGTTYIDGENGKHYQECTACQAKMNEAEHTAGTTYIDGENGKHYQECTACQAKMNETAHTAGTTYTDDGNGKHYQECTACQAKMNETAHTAGTKYINGGNGKHYQECTACQAKVNETEHSAGEGAEWQIKDDRHYRICTVCNGHMDEGAHTTGTEYVDAHNGGHYQVCTTCNGHVNAGNHTAAENAQWQIEGDRHFHICTACNGRMDEATHSPSSQWYTTETGHYHKCIICDQELAESPHTATTTSDLNWLDMDQHSLKKCTVCGKTDVVIEHNFTLYSQTPADPTSTYAYSCPGCGLMPFIYERLDDGNYKVRILLSTTAKNFPASSKEFTLTVPSSFTIDGEVKKLTTTEGLNGGNAPNFKLTKLVISEGIERIAGTFKKLSHLETVVIPEGITSLSYGVFTENPKLTKIVVPKSLAEIKNGKSLVYPGDPDLTAYFVGTSSEWKADVFSNAFKGGVKYYGTDWHWEDETKKDTPVDGAKPVALLPTMITTTQARKREI